MTEYSQASIAPNYYGRASGSYSPTSAPFDAANLSAFELTPLQLVDTTPELTAQETIETFLAIARGARQAQAMEAALGQALRLTRAAVNATLSSTMPTALKIKTCEIPVLELLLEFGQISVEWRAVVVLMLKVNIECGSGHLSVNRAKQVLKELAKRAGLQTLAAELAAPTEERRLAAIAMLGWLKHEKAIEPLVLAYANLSHQEQIEILNVLASHYKGKLAYFLRWQHDASSIVSPLILKIAV